MKKKVIIFTFLAFLIDRIVKILVVEKIVYGQVINLITNFFYLTHVKNHGAAWSIMNGNRILLVIIGFVAVICIYYMFIKEEKLNNYQTVIYSLLLGGVIGNLVDRIFLGYVIDYIGVLIINYKFPIFNIADIFIVVSVILISYSIIKEGEVNGKNNSSRSR